MNAIFGDQCYRRYTFELFKNLCWLCFFLKFVFHNSSRTLPICLFVHTRDTSVFEEKAKVIYSIYMQPRNEIQICSNKHETGLV